MEERAAQCDVFQQKPRDPGKRRVQKDWQQDCAASWRTLHLKAARWSTGHSWARDLQPARPHRQTGLGPCRLCKGVPRTGLAPVRGGQAGAVRSPQPRTALCEQARRLKRHTPWLAIVGATLAGPQSCAATCACARGTAGHVLSCVWQWPPGPPLDGFLEVLWQGQRSPGARQCHDG